MFPTLYQFLKEPFKLEMAKEEDTMVLKKYGDAGDFIVYEKFGTNLAGADSGFRIAFLDEGLKKVRILKRDVVRGKQGFCLEINPGSWYNSLEQLIDFCINDPDLAVQEQFIPTFYRKSMFRSHSNSSPDISSTFQSNSLHPKRFSGSSNFRGTQGISISLPNLNVDRVYSNHPMVQDLLSGRDEGSYVIHEGPNNNEQQPYDIYFVEKSKKEGPPKIKVKKLLVYRDLKDGTYYLAKDSNSRCDSLKQLIMHNKHRFKFPVEDSQYLKIRSKIDSTRPNTSPNLNLANRSVSVSPQASGTLQEEYVHIQRNKSR